MASNRVALITGASSGIGQATAELLAANGFTVFGTSRTPNQAARSYTLLPLDVRSDTSVAAAVQSLLDQTGRIDVLVNNAGYAHVGAIEESGVADMQAQLDTNLYGVLRMLKAVLPVMRQQGSGRIINISSVLGHISPPYAGVYATSKFALEGLTEALREEVRPFGIDVSLIEPTYVKSHIVDQQPTNPLAVYTSGRQAAQQTVRAGVEKGIEPGKVARVILRVATTRPRRRYLVGGDVKFLMLLKRLLPDPLFESLGRRMFSSEKPVNPQLQAQLQK
jgi:NAD(P)-dependent dehydrogenase (short-subunit alcohol dehydrogenase family)